MTRRKNNNLQMKNTNAFQSLTIEKRRTKKGKNKEEDPTLNALSTGPGTALYVRAGAAAAAAAAGPAAVGVEGVAGWNDDEPPDIVWPAFPWRTYAAMGSLLPPFCGVVGFLV